MSEPGATVVNWTHWSDKDRTWCLTKTQQWIPSTIQILYLINNHLYKRQCAKCFANIKWFITTIPPGSVKEKKMFTVLVKAVRQTLSSELTTVGFWSKKSGLVLNMMKENGDLQPRMRTGWGSVLCVRLFTSGCKITKRLGQCSLSHLKCGLPRWCYWWGIRLPLQEMRETWVRPLG